MHGLFYCRYRPFISFVLKLLFLFFPSLQFPKFSLDWSFRVWYSSHFTSLVVINVSDKSAVCIMTGQWQRYSIIWASILTLGALCFLPGTKCSTNDCYFFYIKIQPMFSLLNYPYFQYILHELPSENTVADGIRNLTKIKVNCVHHSFCFLFLISM